MTNAQDADSTNPTHDAMRFIVSSGMVHSSVLDGEVIPTMIRVIRSEMRDYGYADTWVEVWTVPQDFDAAEARLLEEFSANGILSAEEAYKAIRALR